MFKAVNIRWIKGGIFIVCTWLLYSLISDISVTTRFQQAFEEIEVLRRFEVHSKNNVDTAQEQHAEEEARKKVKWWEELFCKGYRRDYSEGQQEKTIFSLKEFLVDDFPNDDDAKNIFMLDNGCNTSVAFRYLCAVESTARYNPNSTMFFLLLTKYLDGVTAEVLTQLTAKQPNVKPLSVDLDLLFKTTPFEKQASQISWTNISDYLYPHLSDFMRFPIMWRYGGIYLDADTIAVRQLPKLKNMYAYVFPKALVACGYIFTKKNHPVMLDTMKYIVASYDGNDWGKQDSAALSDILKIYCGSQSLENGKCEDITFLPVESFQPVNWAHIGRIFEPNYKKNIKEEIGYAYGVHTNSHLTRDCKIELGTGSFFDQLSKEHCPITYYGMINRTVIK